MTNKFFQTPFAQNIFPFISSIIFHLCLIILAFCTIQAVKIIAKEVNIGQTIFGNIDIFEVNQELPNIEIKGDPTRRVFQDKLPNVPENSKGLSDKMGKRNIIAVSGGGFGDNEGIGLIGIGPNGFGIGKKGIGSGIGDGIGSGKDDGIPAPFGIPGGSNLVKFVNMPDKAKKIIFVCDASGSMLNMFDGLRIELLKAINNLTPIQSFNVVFFQDQGYLTLNKNQMMVAIPSERTKAVDFLDKTYAKGETNPLPSLELAFSQNPELVFLLTDGDFNGPGNEAVVNYCKTKTSNGKIKINTIAFIDKNVKDDPQGLEFVKALKQIAKDSGGKFKFVNDDDFGK